MIRLPFIAAAFAVLSPSSAFALDLTLTCQGTSERMVASTAFGSITGTRSSTSGMITSLHRREGAESFQVAVSGDSGKIQVPRRLLPPLHAGGDEGWWPLTGVEVSETEIRAHYTLNPFNHPEVRIDRVTGTISIDGYRQSFRGECAAVNQNARKF